ncbi:MAG TPA: peptidoglycan-binding domain-containing protein [Verrucomicrobiae bacterium]|nr:peptidoglycan-binding domain-containing protein [Verrucomicrobiae bacterium]
MIKDPKAYNINWLRIDGTFGQQTKDVVTFYQAANSLPADGIIGPQTWARIEADCNSFWFWNHEDVCSSRWAYF